MRIRLARVCDSGSTTCAEVFITYIMVNVPAANVLAADVFWTVYFSVTSRAIKQALATHPASPFSFVFFPLPRPASFKTWELDCSLYPFSRFKRNGKEAFRARYSAYPCKHFGVWLRNEHSELTDEFLTIVRRTSASLHLYSWKYMKLFYTVVAEPLMLK